MLSCRRSRSRLSNGFGSPATRVVPESGRSAAELAGLRTYLHCVQSISAQMLDRARVRAASNGWDNIKLLQADATTVELAMLTELLSLGDTRGCADAVLSTYALSLMPGWPNAWRTGLRRANPVVTWRRPCLNRWPGWRVGSVAPISLHTLERSAGRLHRRPGLPPAGRAHPGPRV